MAKKLVDDRKSETRARTNRRERVSKIVDAYTLKRGMAPHRAPRLLKTRARPIGVQARDDEGAAADGVLQEGSRGGANHNRLFTRFAVGKIDQPSLEIDVCPLKGQNLPQSRARKHKEAKSKNHLLPEDRPSVFFSG